MYRGDITLESTLDLKFTTRRFTTGAPFTLAGTPVISAYIDNSTTQLTAGITLTVDFDGVTGLNHVRVAATAANGYAAGTNVQLVITTGTVDSVSVVGEVVAEFSIQHRSSLRPTTAGRTLDVTATGAAGIDWGNVENPTTTLNLSATNIDTDQVVASVSGAVGSVTGAVGSVTGNVGGNVTGSVGSVVAGVTLAAAAVQAIWDALTSALTTVGSIGKLLVDNVNATVSSRASQTTADAIETDTQDIQSRLPAALTAGGNMKADALAISGDTVAADNAEAAFDGGAYNVGGGAIVAASVTGAVGSVTGAVGSVTGNVGGNVAGSVGSVATGGITAASFAAGAIDAAALAADAATEIATAVWAAGTRTLTSFGTLVADTAAAVWAIATATLTTAGTIGKLIVDNLNATITSRASQTTADAIEADTQNLQSRVPAALVSGRMDSSVGAMAAGVITTAAFTAGAVDATVAPNLDATVSSRATPAQVNTEVVDALNVDTYTEPTGAPPATASIQRKVSQTYMALRNGLTVTATEKAFKDDGGATEWSKALADDGVTYTESEGA